jgi:4-amino-4-deoxy-L-arabinose transferase-like glycosyltransferase
MISRLFGSGILLRLLLITASVVLLIQPGSFGQADALFRYQATRSFWTDEQPASEEQIASEFTLIGKDGRHYNWFGLGHPVWMLPLDVIGKGLASVGEKALGISSNSGDQFRRLFVASGTNLMTALLAVGSTYWLVRGLGQDRRCAAGTGFLLLVGTSFLHYAQVAQENNLMLALTLLALAMVRHAIVANQSGWMVAAGAVLGAGMTIRIPFALHVACIALIAVAWRLQAAAVGAERLKHLILDMLRLTPGLALGLIADRVYHFSRFGTWTGTYMAIFRDQLRAKNPALPPDFPFNLGFLEGLQSSVLSWDKFPFLYDPLALVALLMPALLWRRFPAAFRPLMLGATAMILGSAAFHARYAFGDTVGAWGPRYIVSGMQLLVVTACPFVIGSWRSLHQAVRVLIGILAAGAMAVQILSVCFSSILELAQRDPAHPAPPVLVMRFENVKSLVDERGLQHRARRGAGLRAATLNFAPFVIAQQNAHQGPPTGLQRIWFGGVGLAFLQVILFLRPLRSAPSSPSLPPCP